MTAGDAKVPLRLAAAEGYTDVPYPTMSLDLSLPLTARNGFEEIMAIERENMRLGFSESAVWRC